MQWDQQLQLGEKWQPMPGTLLVVSTHPQDEILGAGGLIHTWVSQGNEVTVLSVTDGDSDEIPANHDLLRRDELRAALRKLCATHVSVVRMGLRKGRVREAHNRLRMAIDALLEPRTTLIAPFEGDGSSDHEVVGKVCRESARANAAPLARYMIHGWHQSPASFVGSALNWGKFSLDMEARRCKMYSLQCFMSQGAARNVNRMDPCQRSFEAFLV